MMAEKRDASQLMLRLEQLRIFGDVIAAASAALRSHGDAMLAPAVWHKAARSTFRETPMQNFQVAATTLADAYHVCFDEPMGLLAEPGFDLLSRAPDLAAIDPAERPNYQRAFALRSAVDAKVEAAQGKLRQERQLLDAEIAALR